MVSVNFLVTAATFRELTQMKTKQQENVPDRATFCTSHVIGIVAGQVQHSVNCFFLKTCTQAQAATCHTTLDGIRVKKLLQAYR